MPTALLLFSVTPGLELELFAHAAIGVPAASTAAFRSTIATGWLTICDLREYSIQHPLSTASSVPSVPSVGLIVTLMLAGPAVNVFAGMPSVSFETVFAVALP